MNKARITYRFDGHNRGTRERRPPEQRVIPLSEEEFRVVEEKPPQVAGNQAPEPQAEERTDERREAPVLVDFTTDFGQYRSPFAEETERVERIIRGSRHVDGETGYVDGLGGGGREHADRAGGRERQAERGRGEKDSGPERPAERELPRGTELYEAGHAEQYRDPFATGYEGYRSDERETAFDWGGRQSEHRPAGGEREFTGGWGEPQIGARYVRSSSTPPWTRIVLSVAGAVLTGVIFGILVLSMFTGNGLPFLPTGKGKTNAPVAGVPGSGNAGSAAGTSGASSASGASGVTDKTASSSANGASLVTVNLPAHTYYLLQNGIFSTPATAQVQETELKKKGYAAASEQGEKTTVFAGFAIQKEDAVLLSNKLKADKLDVFVKTADVPAAPKLKWSGKASAADLSGFFQQGDKLLQMIGSLTVLHLAETKPAAIEQASLDAVKSVHQAWTAASAQVKAGSPDDVAPAIEQMTKGLSAAVSALDEYRKSPSAPILWQAQGSLLQYLLAEKSLLANLAAQ